MKIYFLRQINRPLKTNHPVHGFLLAAGCLFTEGNFVTEVPYDPNYYFYGEEISLMLKSVYKRIFNFSYSNIPIFHLYNNDPSTSGQTTSLEPR